MNEAAVDGESAKNAVRGSSVRVFALTGGIGTGKSRVAAHWQASGLPIIDADELARLAVLPNTACLAAISREFGAEILSSDGTLDRGQLASRVFNDAEARRRLDAIVHPVVAWLAASRVEELARRGYRVACYEVPLLYEAGLAQRYRPVVVVAAPEATQIDRLVNERALTREQAQARVASQIPIAEKATKADYVIDNSGAWSTTEREADEVLDRVLTGFGLSRADLTRP